MGQGRRKVDPQTSGELDAVTVPALNAVSGVFPGNSNMVFRAGLSAL